jgi:D-alanyl-D-alanine dipeptidase
MHWMHESPRFEFERFGLGRLSLAQMLAKAQSYLPANRSLIIVGVFRPFETQRAMYERVMAETKEKHPHWSHDYVIQYINVFAAPPVRETPPPHTTGGAVDLGIVDEHGERLDFVSPFEMGWESAPTFIEGLSPEARRNRDLLIDVLTAAGLTNFRGEWWHWSYGEPGWALRGGHRAALYGAVPDDQIPSWTPPPKK